MLCTGALAGTPLTSCSVSEDPWRILGGVKSLQVCDVLLALHKL